MALECRGELFLLLEPWAGEVVSDRHRSVRSFEVTAHRRRPEAAAPLPEAASAANGGQIVFTPTANGGYQGNNRSIVTKLALADPGAKGPTDLLKLQGYCREPVFSPDGKRVAASVWVNGRGQIYLINAVGGEHRNISNNEHCDRSPRFSPDGGRIVFVSDRGGNWDIWSMKTDGGEVRRLTVSPYVDRSPAYSPDGKRIAFISDRGGDFDVYVMAADGADQRRVASIAGHEYEPTWSPDGDFIAFTMQHGMNRRILLCQPDGTDSRTIGAGNRLTDVRSLRFSPDGGYLAAACSKLHDSGDGILVVGRDAKAGAASWQPDGKGVRRIVAAGPMRTRPPWYYVGGSGSPRWIAKTFSGVSFSPDGKKLVYCSDQGDDGAFRLYTIDVTGGKPTPVPSSESNWPTSTCWSRR